MSRAVNEANAFSQLREARRTENSLLEHGGHLDDV